MIEHLKSGLSLSTHVGCAMSCSYCVLSGLDDFQDGPVEVCEPEQLITRLLSGRELFKNGKTPLILNNRTDPLLHQVVPYTVRLLDLMEVHRITSPILLISKFAPGDELRPYFRKLPLMYIYSYSNLPTDFNYGCLDEDLKQIEKVVPKGQRYHYFRPIIPGRNDDLDGIVDCIRKFQTYDFSGSIMTGLRLTEQNQRLLMDTVKYDTQHKFMKEGMYSAVLRSLADTGMEYMVYRHTSCAIASFLHTCCSLGYYGKPEHCYVGCINAKNCSGMQRQNAQNLLNELTDKFGTAFDAHFEDEILVINSSVTQEQTAFIKNAFGIRVLAKHVVLSPSERRILGYE